MFVWMKEIEKKKKSIWILSLTVKPNSSFSSYFIGFCYRSHEKFLLSSCLNTSGAVQCVPQGPLVILVEWTPGPNSQHLNRLGRAWDLGAICHNLYFNKTFPELNTDGAFWQKPGSDPTKVRGTSITKFSAGCRASSGNGAGIGWGEGAWLRTVIVNWNSSYLSTLCHSGQWHTLPYG